MLFSSDAFAMASPNATGGAAGGGILQTLLPFVLMFGVLYFLLIRPQQKKAKQHQQFLNNLKKGDMIITAGGMYAKIAGISENIITLELGDKVKIKVSRSAIAGQSTIDIDSNNQN